MMTRLSKIPPNKFFKRGDFKVLLRKARRSKLLRPTVTMVIKQEGSAQFLIQQKKTEADRERFDLLKGGIDNGESILEALYREAEEECCLAPCDFIEVRPVGNIVSYFTSTSKRRDGYRLGKLHFVYLVVVSSEYVPQVGVDQNVVDAFLTDDPLSFFTKKHGNPYVAKIIKAAQKMAD